MGFLASLDRRRVATVLVVLLIAFLTGHVMQTVLAEDKPVATIDAGPDAAPELKRGEQPKPLPVPPAATLVPIGSEGVAPVRAGGSAPDRDARGSGCTPVLRLTEAPAATLKVEVEAPCDGGARVALRQGPVVVEGVTDAEGRLVMRLPALEREALIDAEVGGRRVSARAEVAEARAFQHVAILWRGPQVLKINAYEFGAEKSQFGHVWQGSPKSPSRASRGSGGFLTRLGGAEGASAEIYSFPAGHSPVRGVVRLVVEAEVTRANCGRRVEARALQTGPLGRLSETEVALTMPGCDRLGEILQLQNLLQDMRLAGR